MLSALLLGALLTSAPAAKKQVAVLELEAAGVPKDLVETASLLVPTEVRRNLPDASVISGAEIKSMIGFERQKELLGCAEESTSCMTELGGALGADELVTGKIGKLGTTYVLELRRMDAKQARPISSTTRTIDQDADFIPAIRAGVAELYGAAPPPPTASKRGGLGRYAWIPAASAAVIGGVGAFSLMQATSRHNELIGATPSTTPPETLRDQGRMYQALGNVAVGVAIGAAGVAALMFLSDSADDGAEEAKVVAGTFELTAAGVRW